MIFIYYPNPISFEKDMVKDMGFESTIFEL